MNNLTQSEYARHRGCSRQFVNQQVKSGRIPVDESGRIDPAIADSILKATESPEPHHQAHGAVLDAERGRSKGAADSSGSNDQLLAADEISRRMKMAAMRERETRAQMAAIELDVRVGELIPRVDIERLLIDLAKTTRTKLEQYVDQMTPRVMAAGGETHRIHSELEDGMADLLREISNEMKRKAEILEVGV